MFNNRGDERPLFLNSDSGRSRSEGFLNRTANLGAPLGISRAYRQESGVNEVLKARRTKSLLNTHATAIFRENERSAYPRDPAICWSITPKWVDRQTGIITG